MTNLKVIDFIKWALTHAKSVPTGAAMPLPIDACCADPWHYLFGSVRVQTTPATLARYRQAYVNRGWAGADLMQRLRAGGAPTMRPTVRGYWIRI